MQLKLLVGMTLLLATVNASSPGTAAITGLNELESLPESVNINDSRPLDSSHWAYKTLENISRTHGLVVGDSKAKFDIKKPLSRNEAAVLLISLVGRIQEDKVQISEVEKIQLDILRQEFNSDIAKLTGRVDGLDKTVAQLNGTVQKLQDNDKKVVKMNVGEDFKIRGAFLYRYGNSLNKGVDNNTKSPNGFSLPLCEIDLVGKLHKHLDYTANFFLSRNFDNAANSIMGDVFLTTDKIKNHKVFMGLMRTPIGYEGTKPPFSLDVADRSQLARNFSDLRDLGMKVSGSYPMIDYTVGAFNGNANNRNDVNNSSLAFGEWVVLKPLYKVPGLGKLEIGGGNYTGKYSTGSALLTTSSEIYQNTNSLYAAYEYKRNKISSEWAHKKGYLAEGRNAQGLYLQDALFLNKNRTRQLVFRFDTFDPDQTRDNDKQTEYTIGYNHFIKGQNLKVQVDGTHVNNVSGKDSDRFVVQTQYMF